MFSAFLERPLGRAPWAFTMVITYLGLGSNLGNRERNISKALALIGESFRILGASSLYVTEPVGFTDQPSFLNMVVKIDAGETEPRALLDAVKSAEFTVGRSETFRWGPRVIDIDILYMDGVEHRSGDELEIPHRELLNRNFALIPLSELTERIRVGGKDVVLKDKIKENSGPGSSVTLYKGV
jgi:2-amino-4-hydroxy-6-hydroxymethyldihydropteridine diphosphokinase